MLTISRSVASGRWGKGYIGEMISLSCKDVTKQMDICCIMSFCLVNMSQW